MRTGDVMELPLPHLVESSVASLTSEQVAAAFNRAFEEYLVPLNFTPQSYERRMRGENLDPHASYVYSLDGAPVALILIARRGWTSRVAGMAVAPGFRGQGVGGRILSKAIDDARKRGDRRVLLEVIEGNQPAMKLYTKAGFCTQRRLVGFTRMKTTAFEETCDALEDVDPSFVSYLICREEGPDWPWNLAPQTLGALSPPSRALALDDVGFAIVSQKDQNTMLLHAIFVTRLQRKRGHGRRLLNALGAVYPDFNWSFTPLIPEGLVDGWFLRNKWSRHPLAQLEMELPLGPLLSCA